MNSKKNFISDQQSQSQSISKCSNQAQRFATDLKDSISESEISQSDQFGSKSSHISQPIFSQGLPSFNFHAQGTNHFSGGLSNAPLSEDNGANLHLQSMLEREENVS